ncbi:hypothetical protein MMC14_003497 [Varicellaria rhodocarpa]|nr:hypothetical protein [Varicellaria rhodocarpa]
MGTRSNFEDIIANKTGIDKEVLDGEDPALSSVAKRMSWASQRKITRVEDLAHCLMRLFEANVPLIYDKKHKAFLRLQAETMETSEDHSFLAWKTHCSGRLLAVQNISEYSSLLLSVEMRLTQENHFEYFLSGTKQVITVGAIGTGQFPLLVFKIVTKTVYIALDVVGPKARATSAYRFYLPKLSEDLL